MFLIPEPLYEVPRDMCGIGLANSVFDAEIMLRGLEHRGEDSSGMSGIVSDGSINSIRWLGKVYTMSLLELEEIFGDTNKINKINVHTRYATSETDGSKNELLRDAHPITIDGNYVLERGKSYTSGATSAIVHNGQIVCTDIVNPFVAEMKTGTDTELLLRIYQKFGIHQLIEQVPAAYSAIILDDKKVIGFRDGYGMKPLWLGEKDGNHLLCSEDFPIRKIGGKPIREVNPGEIVIIEDDNKAYFEQVVKPNKKFCFFEFNYQANERSSFNGQIVWDVRKSLGERLAEENDTIEADFVTPVPNAAIPYAMGFSEKSSIPYLPILKKKKKERSFLQSTQKKRKDSIDSNLYVDAAEIGLLKGKSAVVVDDSVIRGTVLGSVAEKLKYAGVTEIYFLSGTSPMGRNKNCFCGYGVDMPPEDEFLMRRFENEEQVSAYISEKHGIPFRLHYISLDGMFDVLGNRKEYCTQCVNGERPIKIS